MLAPAAVVMTIALVNLAATPAPVSSRSATAPQRPSAGAPAPYWPGWDIARGVALEADAAGGHVVDAWGGTHAFGTANSTGVSDYRPGDAWVRSAAWLPDAPRPVIIDDHGAVHTPADAPRVLPVVGVDAARRAIAFTTVAGTIPGAATGLTVSGDGVLTRLAGSPAFDTTGASVWPGRDVVRGVALQPDGTGGFTLDGWGGVHAFGHVAVNTTSAYWPGWDIARGIAVDGQGNGVVLDGWGGLHSFTYTFTPAADQPACTAAQLRAGGGWARDRGTLLGRLTLANTGAAACRISGRPTVAIVGASGTPLAVESLPFESGPEAQPRPVVVEPGDGVAYAVLEWSNWCGEPADGLVVTPPGSMFSPPLRVDGGRFGSRPGCADPAAPSVFRVGVLEAGST
jgi:hypothetical protein